MGFAVTWYNDYAAIEGLPPLSAEQMAEASLEFTPETSVDEIKARLVAIGSQ